MEKNIESRFRESFDPEEIEVRENRRVFHRALLVVGALCLLLLALPASAGHEDTHRGLVLGERTNIVIRLHVCDKEEEAMAVVMAQEKSGYEAASAVLRYYSSMVNAQGDKVCGIINSRLLAIRVVYSKLLDFPSGKKQTSVIELLDDANNTYFAILVDVEIQKTPGRDL